MTGTPIGTAVVGERAEKPGKPGRYWFVHCACGIKRAIRATDIRARIKRGQGYQCVDCYSAKPAWTWHDFWARKRAAQ